MEQEIPVFPFSFYGLKTATLASARFVILPFPYELTTTGASGTRNGPSAIIEASLLAEEYDDELEFCPSDAGIYTHDFFEPVVAAPEKMVQRVYEATRKILALDKIPVSLGGEHTISIGTVAAFKERFPALSVLHLDAHADMRTTFFGSPYCHACVGRRISELTPLVQVGIRSFSQEETHYLKQEAIPVYSAAAIMRQEEEEWIPEVVEQLSDDVYVTLDVDVFDISIMPAVGTPEPGGMGWYSILRLLKRVAETKRIVGFDVVELSPLPGILAPNFLAAKLVYKMIGYSEASVERRKGRLQDKKRGGGK